MTVMARAAGSRDRVLMVQWSTQHVCMREAWHVHCDHLKHVEGCGWKRFHLPVNVFREANLWVVARV